MKNKTPISPIVKDIRDKEESRISKALRTESIKLAIESGYTKDDVVIKSKQIYDFIEFGVIPNNNVGK